MNRSNIKGMRQSRDKRKPFNPGYMSGEFYHWRIMGFESRAACEAHYGNDSA